MQVMDIVDRLFVTMFDKLNENCKKELEAVGRQYPFEPLKVMIAVVYEIFEMFDEVFNIIIGVFVSLGNFLIQSGF